MVLMSSSSSPYEGLEIHEDSSLGGLDPPRGKVEGEKLTNMHMKTDKPPSPWMKRTDGRRQVHDEDINTIVTPTTPATIHTGPITRARARQLNYQVLRFLVMILMFMRI